jgi:hypothetical protein
MLLILKGTFVPDKRKAKPVEAIDEPLMPFDEALKLVWRAPPAPNKKPQAKPKKQAKNPA